MGDAYWRFSDPRQQPPPQQQQQPSLPPVMGKRPRSEFDAPGGHELPPYFARGNERAPQHVPRDAENIGASYDRYLHNAQLAAFGGRDPARPMNDGLNGRPIDDPRMGMGPDPTKVQPMGFGGGGPEISLPADASNTLFVEGLPANCSRREVAHIFRPFVGYKEVRLVTKESKRSGGDPLVLCFVDFASPAHAATAKDALHGYKFDEDDRDSFNLRLQFARFPGARSGGGSGRDGGGRDGGRGDRRRGKR